MRWVTRTGVRMDRAAMIWLIRREIDPSAEITLLPEAEVMEFAEEQQATPFHHPQAPLRNTGLRTGFDALITHYQLANPVLAVMALAMRGAETQDRTITPWSSGLRAIGNGLRSLHAEDEVFITAMGTVLDGLYQFCADQLAPVEMPVKTTR